jgi:hypothetical protein
MIFSDSEFLGTGGAMQLDRQDHPPFQLIGVSIFAMGKNRSRLDMASRPARRRARRIPQRFRRMLSRSTAVMRRGELGVFERQHVAPSRVSRRGGGDIDVYHIVARHGLSGSPSLDW